jgi:hypothetical protein
VHPERGIEQLQAEHGDHEDCAENLARLALGEPAIDPGEDGADEQEIEHCKDEQGDGCPEEKGRPGSGYARKEAERA